MDPREVEEGLGQKVLRPCMGSECLKYSFKAGPKSLNAPVYHHSASLRVTKITSTCNTLKKYSIHINNVHIP